ncbi:hypothetical protein J8273_0600 [Carpediemonas membranifera]|uniref:Uncharacterized protein n=1 Tax=Carpediemonas membranifera TaxID=201153 RepID=A0A8J6B476_9EUKA|nr:hypothetical protein J8273_0600 [Carpediemonas membranifera]|eukprot:KAG9395358.1 hypothetical protein J8273_0600 [Carpediemonas membranifera]
MLQGDTVKQDGVPVAYMVKDVNGDGTVAVSDYIKNKLAEKMYIGQVKRTDSLSIRAHVTDAVVEQLGMVVEEGLDSIHRGHVDGGLNDGRRVVLATGNRLIRHQKTESATIQTMAEYA